MNMVAKKKPVKTKTAKPTPKQLKGLREGLGLTQAAISEKLGVHITTWQCWEYGRRQPNAAAVALIRLLEQKRF